jgi:hypothetical protein
MSIEAMKFRYKTADGRVILPTIHLDYVCKQCGYANKLLVLTGADCQSVDLHECVPHESLCHKCDDVEIITVEVMASAYNVKGESNG